MEVITNMFPLSFSITALLFCVQWPAQSFTVDLIHRNSPQSPFYNRSATKWDQINGTFLHLKTRSAIHKKISSKSPNDIQSWLDSGNGEFIMKLFVGTPPVPQFALVDTGSDLIWFQVKKCELCYDQKSPGYDPEHSATYRNISCNTPSCKIVKCSTCFVNETDNCNYFMEYSGSSTVSGYVGTETFTFEPVSGLNTSIPEIIFGCGTRNYINYDKFRIDGLLGLGPGKESFINQASKYMPRKFSYCLPPFDSSPNATGKISFGDSVQVITPDTVITPLKIRNPTYAITIESISVNNESFSLLEGNEINEMSSDLFVDSGTTLTLLPAILYNKLYLEVVKSIPAKVFRGTLSDICYKSEDIITFPKIRFKLEGGSELDLAEESTFMHVDPTTVCLAIISSGTNDFGLIGNVVQANFLIGFDLDKYLVSFKPSDCTKQLLM